MSSKGKTKPSTYENKSSLELVSPALSISEYIHSPLIHEVYLNNDLRSDFPKFWSRLGVAEDGFGAFFQGIKELALDTKRIGNSKLNHEETVKLAVIPVLEILGWATKSDSLLSKNLLITSKSGDEISIKPTCLLFTDENEASAFSQTIRESAKPPSECRVIPVATSYFGSWADQRVGKINKDRAQLGKFGDIFSVLGTDEQNFNYLDLLSCEWGFSTDGHSWRLIKRSAFAIDHNKYFEFNLYSFLNSLSTARPHEEDQLIEIAKYFYWFFSKESHQVSKPNQISLTWERSQRYSHNIEDDLRARFVAGISIAVNALWSSSKQNGAEFSSEHLQDISESLIFNILFIRSCESRRILPLHQAYIPVSLHNLVSKLRDFEPASKTIDNATLTRMSSIFPSGIDEKGHEIFDYLINLFELTNDTSKKTGFFGFAIEGFKENIFSKQEWTTLKKTKIDNLAWAKILSTIFYMERNKQVPFNTITPQQFGSIFESFLEYRLLKVVRPQYLVRRLSKNKVNISWEEHPKRSDSILYIAQPGSLYFSPDKSDRKISGSYYTPDHIVDYIVREALGPLVKKLDENSFFNIKVLDPAMGSGHFLISALRYLTSEYLKLTENFTASVPAIKRQILHHCIFGVDKSYRAIKLAKLALWLETAEAGRSLEHLDDQIKCADSLTGDVWENSLNFKFDAIIGNPPYLKEANNKQLFDQLRDSRMGQYCVGRMDLWYLFSILSVRLLKDCGRHSFIAPNSWFASEGATKLRQIFRNELAFEKCLDFGDYKVFDEASIQTMIFVATKKRPNRNDCLYHRFSKDSNQEMDIVNFLRSLKNDDFTPVSLEADKTDSPFVFVNSNLDSILFKCSNGRNVRNFTSKEIGNGIDVLQDFVATNHMEKLKGNKHKKGSGIFVLTPSEMKAVCSSSKDKLAMKPYYTPSELGRFFNVKNNKYWLIYANDEVRKSINQYPGIKKHLDYFRPVLTSAFAPYGLNRAREESLFSSAAIYSLRKTMLPSFSYAQFPAYVSRAFMILKPSMWRENNHYLVGFLNSKFVHAWLFNKGKKQGDQLQIDKEPLASIPIRTIDFDSKVEVGIHDRIVVLSKQLSTLDRNKEANVATIQLLEEEINTLVFKLLGLTASEIKQLTDTLPTKIESMAKKKSKAA